MVLFVYYMHWKCSELGKRLHMDTKWMHNNELANKQIFFCDASLWRLIVVEWIVKYIGQASQRSGLWCNVQCRPHNDQQLIRTGLILQFFSHNYSEAEKSVCSHLSEIWYLYSVMTWWWKWRILWIPQRLHISNHFSKWHLVFCPSFLSSTRMIEWKMKRTEKKERERQSFDHHSIQ